MKGPSHMGVVRVEVVAGQNATWPPEKKTDAM